NFIEAAEYYLKIIREYNSEEIYANSLFNYALSLYMLGKLDESEKILKEYLSKFPKDDDRKYEIYIKLGDINYNRGNIAQALEQYQNSLLFFEKNKLKSWAYYQIGNCYNYAKQINEAFIAYMTVVKFFPNSVEYYQALEAIEKLKTNNKLVDYKIWQENNPTYKFFIQVGAFKNKANAEKLLNDYSKKKEFNQKIIRILQDGDLYKVRIGNFFSYEEAQKFKRENKLSGFILTE
ncbi:MAG TPA: SPOR domain-containing protein, partial [bacterium]|nr:SPOR domain-containing protein [bacterium]